MRKEKDWNNDLPSKRMSFAIFIRDADIVFTAPLLSTKASCAAYLRRKEMMRTHSDEIIEDRQNNKRI